MLPYHDCLNDARLCIDEINHFLGGELKKDAMIKCVDPTLFRSKINSIN